MSAVLPDWLLPSVLRVQRVCGVLLVICLAAWGVVLTAQRGLLSAFYPLFVAVAWFGVFVLAEVGRVRETDSLAPSPVAQDSRVRLSLAGGLTQCAAVTYGLCGIAPLAARSYLVLSLALGVSLMFAGSALRLRCFALLGRSFTLDVRSVSGHRLVTGGPYRYLRHPAYLGGLVSLVGFGVALNSWLAVFHLAVVGLLIYVRRIAVEEASLRVLFGVAYARFCAGRARLIPWLY